MKVCPSPYFDEFIDYVIKGGERPSWFYPTRRDDFGLTATYYWYEYNQPASAAPDWLLHPSDARLKGGRTVTMHLFAQPHDSEDIDSESEATHGLSKEVLKCLKHDPLIRDDSNLTCAHVYRWTYPNKIIPSWMMYEGFPHDVKWSDNLYYFVKICDEMPEDFDPSWQDEDGYTAAMAWIFKNRSKPPDWMIHDPNIKNNHGNTCMMLWCTCVRDECPQEFWHDPNITNSSGETALMRLISEQPELNEFPAYIIHDPLITDDFGYTAAMQWLLLRGETSDYKAQAKVEVPICLRYDGLQFLTYEELSNEHDTLDMYIKWTDHDMYLHGVTDC